MSKLHFSRRLLLLVAAAISFVPPLPLHADYAAGDPRLSRLYRMFIAPCCWRENLLTHQSPKAEELRADIKRAVAAGLTDDQIKQQLVTEYSKRILSMPEGAQADVLWWTPIAFTLSGCALVVFAIRESVHKNRQNQSQTQKEISSHI